MNLSQHLKKGKPITVVGKYSNRLYQSQSTGQWGISNDVIASDIYFEIGSEHQENSGASTTTNTRISPEKAAAQVANAVDEIPQATSRKLTQLKTMVGDNSSGTVGLANVGDDDLPF